MSLLFLCLREPDVQKSLSILLLFTFCPKEWFFLWIVSGGHWQFSRYIPGKLILTHCSIMFSTLPNSRHWCRPDCNHMQWFKRHFKYTLNNGQETCKEPSWCNAESPFQCTLTKKAWPTKLPSSHHMVLYCSFPVHYNAVGMQDNVSSQR